MVNFIGFFSYVELALHYWDKLHLVMMEGIVGFNLLKSSLEFLCLYYEGYWTIISFSIKIFSWFWNQGKSGFIEWDE